MTWESKTMPDDAPELAGSLVGSMLGVRPANPKPTSNDRQIRSSRIDGELPGILFECSTIAEEIEAVRDWLVPDEPEPVSSNLLEAVGHREWRTNQILRDRLTEQARIARGEQ